MSTENLISHYSSHRLRLTTCHFYHRRLNSGFDVESAHLLDAQSTEKRAIVCYNKI